MAVWLGLGLSRMVVVVVVMRVWEVVVVVVLCAMPWCRLPCGAACVCCDVHVPVLHITAVILVRGGTLVTQPAPPDPCLVLLKFDQGVEQLMQAGVVHLLTKHVITGTRRSPGIIAGRLSPVVGRG